MNLFGSQKKSHTSKDRRRQLFFRLSLMLLVVSLSFHASAQITTADITGTVTDAQGGVLPNAAVTLTNLGTKETHVIKTSAQGEYLFTLLEPGHYSIRVEVSGFELFSVADLAVEGGDRARVDAKMTVGTASQTVEVTAATPLLQADNSTVSSTVTSSAVENLPLNGRNFIQLVQLEPGANEGPGNGLTSGARPDDRRTTNGLSVNGQDDVLNNEIIDGLDNNERIIGTIGVKPSVEAIQEITVQTNEYAPEMGRTAGGVIDVVTRSGSNTFHGSLSEFFRNDIFDARSFFSRVGSVPKPELRQNQYGGSIGGPIIRNKTFFFGDYEGFRQVYGQTTYTSTVPSVAEYDDINSINGGTPQALINSGNGTQGLPVNPIALNYLKLFPLPNSGGANAVTNNYVSNAPKTQYSTTVDARVDHNFNTNNTLYARFTYNNVSTYNPAQLPFAGANAIAGVIPGGGRYNFSGAAKDLAYGYQLNFTHVFSPKLVLELKAGYTRINNLSTPLNYGNNVDTAFGFPSNMNFNQQASGLSPVQINNFEDLGDGAYVPLQDVDNTFEYAGNVSYTVGPHNFKFGAALIRRQASNLQSASALGAYTFGLSTDTSGTFSIAQQNDNVLASMAAGAFSSPTRQYDLFVPGYRSWEPSVYWQDFWKVTPKLTVTYGARYDVYTPFTEPNNRISNFNFPLALTLTAANINSALQVAGQNGVSSTAGIVTDYSNFAPRVGFALTVARGTVVRGGFGLSYFPGNYTSNSDLKNAPFVSVYSPTCQSPVALSIQTKANGGNATGFTAACGTTAGGAGTGATTTLQQGLPLPAAPNISNISLIPGLTFNAENPHLRNGVVDQFNLLVERAFGPNVFTIGYVGEIGTHQPQQLNDINLPPPTANTSPSYLLGSVLPNLGSVGYYDSEGVSNYNALQTSLERRLSHGLTLNANYTWSHTLDDFTGLSEEGDQGFSNANPHDIRGTEYGNADNDIRNRFVLESTYALPFGQNFQGLKRQVAGGWQFNEIFAWQTGKAFSVENSSAGGCLNNGVKFTAPTGNCSHPYVLSPGNDRPNIIASTKISNPSNAEWFNTAAFQGQQIGTVSNQERNQLFGPHFRHLDVSLFKDFPIREALTMQFRAEFFDITNTPSFYMPNNNSGNAQFGNGSFGQITSTDPNYTPRQIQFALRATF